MARVHEPGGSVVAEIHPDCVLMHKRGYCVCTMVQCGVCDQIHPPHKPHVKLKIKTEEKKP
jgi:hypothetical protein